MIYYVIRHKETKQIMPLAKRGRGYSHWNPGSNNQSFSHLFLDIPRLLKSEKQANQCIVQWNCMPNAKNTFDHDGEYGVDTKEDGRKKEDLEVIKVTLTLDEY